MAELNLKQIIVPRYSAGGKRSKQGDYYEKENL